MQYFAATTKNVLTSGPIRDLIIVDKVKGIMSGPPIIFFLDFGLEKACSRSETNLSQNSDFEYSEVTMNCHQPMSSLLANEHSTRLPPTHQINAYTLSRDGDGALLMSHEHNRNDETDSGCSSMPGENSLLR